MPGNRVEHRDRLVQHEQPRPPGQRQGQGELRLLTAGHAAGGALQRDIQLGEPCLAADSSKRGLRLRVRCSMSAAERFCTAGCPARRTRCRPAPARSRPHAAEDGDSAGRRRRQADRQVQQRGLAGTVRADERDDVTGWGSRASTRAAPRCRRIACRDQSLRRRSRDASPSRPPRRAAVPNSRSALVNSATIPSSSSPAVSAVSSQTSSGREAAPAPAARPG